MPINGIQVVNPSTQEIKDRDLPLESQHSRTLEPSDPRILEPLCNFFSDEARDCFPFSTFPENPFAIE